MEMEKETWSSTSLKAKLDESLKNLYLANDLHTQEMLAVIDQLLKDRASSNRAMLDDNARLHRLNEELRAENRELARLLGMNAESLPNWQKWWSGTMRPAILDMRESFHRSVDMLTQICRDLAHSVNEFPTTPEFPVKSPGKDFERPIRAQEED